MWNSSWTMGLPLISYPHMCTCVSLVTRNSRILRKLRLLYRCTTNLKPKLWSPLDCLYEIRATERNTIYYYVIVPGKELHCILGKRAIKGMELITVHSDMFLTKTQVQSDVISQIDIKEEVSEKYANVFKDLGKLDDKLHSEVTNSVRPVKLPPRKIPLALKPKVKEELCRLEKLGVIKPVKTLTDWVSALVVAPKRNGDIRLFIDPKPLNEALMRNHYPTPTIEDNLPQ